LEHAGISHGDILERHDRVRTEPEVFWDMREYLIEISKYLMAI